MAGESGQAVARGANRPPLTKRPSHSGATAPSGVGTIHVAEDQDQGTEVDGDERKITFIDTPGHEAFTAMRARGAETTDLVVLVVAADDGVKPQTTEALNHAQAAGVPIVVAVNKVDKEGADPQRVRAQLTEYGLVAEEFGGDTQFVDVSATKRTGLENLLEAIVLNADASLDLRANPNQDAQGVAIEGHLDKGRGPVATVLVQEGTLQPGDSFVGGTQSGRIRAMVDDKGRRIEAAGPSTPVEVRQTPRARHRRARYDRLRGTALPSRPCRRSANPWRCSGWTRCRFPHGVAPRVAASA